MFFELTPEVAQQQLEVQALLDEHNSFPEADLIALAGTASKTPDTEAGAALRAQVLALDDMIAQLRWQLAQAVLIWRSYPDLFSSDAHADDMVVKHGGMSTKALLLLRPWLRSQSRVFYSSIDEEKPGGGTVGGWMIHLMVDGCVERSAAILDRLALLCATAAGVTFPNDKVYFRSRKLSVISKKVGPELGDPLVTLAEGEDLQFLIQYRNGLAHTHRPAAWVSGTPGLDNWTDDSGERVFSSNPNWDGSDLVTIALMAYDLTCQALGLTVPVCTKFAPQESPAGDQ